MIVTNPPEDLREQLFKSFESPGLHLKPPIGQLGYSLPSLGDLKWYEIPGTSNNNWVLSKSPDFGYSFDVAEGCHDNLIVLDRESTCFGRIVIRGSRNQGILYGSNAGHQPVNVHFHSSHHSFFFGRGATSNTTTFEMGSDGTSIIVGEDCMFSAFIDVTTDDMHGIFDIETCEHLNPARDILFEPHVWVGLHSMILKGVKIGFGSIVGAGSVVTRDVPAKSAVAGSPAKLVRSNVSWTRARHPGENCVRDLQNYEASITSNPTKTQK